MYARIYQHRAKMSKKDIALKRRSTSTILFTQNFQSLGLLSEQIKLNKEPGKSINPDGRRGLPVQWKQRLTLLAT
jgi:hypothetical protein